MIPPRPSGREGRGSRPPVPTAPGFTSPPTRLRLHRLAARGRSRDAAGIPPQETHIYKEESTGLDHRPTPWLGRPHPLPRRRSPRLRFARPAARGIIRGCVAVFDRRVFGQAVGMWGTRLRLPIRSPPPPSSAVFGSWCDPSDAPRITNFLHAGGPLPFRIVEATRPASAATSVYEGAKR